MKIREHLTAIYDRLGQIDQNLEEHMRRSIANEKAVEVIQEALSPIKTEFEIRQQRWDDFKRVAISVIAGLVLAGLMSLVR